MWLACLCDSVIWHDPKSLIVKSIYDIVTSRSFSYSFAISTKYVYFLSHPLFHSFPYIYNLLFIITFKQALANTHSLRTGRIVPVSCWMSAALFSCLQHC